MGLLKLLFIEFGLRGSLLLGNALLDGDHFLLGQRAAAHGNQRNDPADDRQSKLEYHGHPEDGRGGRIRGLGHRGGVAQQRHSAGSDHSGKRGDELIDQAVGAGDNGGDITPAAVQLKVNGIRHVRGVGGGDAHIGAVLQKAQHHIDDHGRAAHDADLLGVNDNEEQDFLIESESHNKTYFDGGVRPKDGGWVKIQNGVPVIVAASYENAIQGDVFNADVAEGGATANDEITTSEITVIAGEGNVTIANAAGKKVVVSNILGQIVATQVLTSDNAVIAAPQGVVVVAVEGEEAVKAIVR